jgi:hypothetical protein
MFRKLKKKNKKTEIQFKFLFSLIFGAFLFGFIFLFIVQTFFLYQKYTVYNLYDTILAFLDIINLKKNTAAVIKITSLSGYKIDFKGDSISISMFLENQNFPLYNKIIFSPTIESNTIYYDTKAVYLPFYVYSLTLLIPINEESFLFKKDKNSFIITGKEEEFVDKFYIDEINPSFEDSIPFCRSSFKSCLSLNNIKKTNIKRVLFLYNESIDNDDILFLEELKDGKDKIKDSDKFWIVKAKKIGEFVYEVKLLKKPISGKDLKERIERWRVDFFIDGGTYYVPKEFVFASLLVNDKKYFEKNLEKFYRNVYRVYLSYKSINTKDFIFSRNCEPYNELEEITNELDKVLKGESNYNFKNITLFISPLAEKIEERNKYFDETYNPEEKPVCQLY